MCSSLETQAVIRFKYLLLSQSEIAFGNCNAAVVEKFHQLHKGKFAVLTVHCVNLPAKGLAERVATEILNLQSVAYLNLLQNDIYPLNGKYRSLLAEEYRCANAGWVNVVIALGYMLPKLRVQAYDSSLACLLFDYGKLFGVQYLPPSESKNIRNSQSCETTDSHKKRDFVIPVFC